ncbi:MAG: hypothetical protein LM577_05515 [Thermoproteaceae archaeon]|nr:hypothetical protein [Thermoproteaceae archaeon]
MRGLSTAASAALMLALSVAIAVALWWVAGGIVASTPAPRVQLDAYNSKVFGTTARVVLKFGENVKSIDQMQILDQTGAALASCTASGGPFQAGYSYEFTCSGQSVIGGTRLVVRVAYTAADGSKKVANLEWALG